MCMLLSADLHKFVGVDVLVNSIEITKDKSKPSEIQILEVLSKIMQKNAC
jgi:hypothetical protein